MSSIVDTRVSTFDMNKTERDKKLREEIRVLTAELHSYEPAEHVQKIIDFHDFCVSHFGRRLKVGDRIVRTRMVYRGSDERGQIYKRKEFVAEIAEPRVYDGYPDGYDDLCRIIRGYVNVDVKNIRPDKYPDMITKTTLRRCRLVEK